VIPAILGAKIGVGRGQTRNLQWGERAGPDTRNLLRSAEPTKRA
jgi:hypothetical protein